MFKRFKEIKEHIKKTTLVPGSNPHIANRKANKVPGFARGKQYKNSPQNTGQYKLASVPKEVSSGQSGIWDSPKKDHSKYSKIHQAAYVHEDGVAGGGGAAGSAAGGMVAGVNQTSGSIYKDPNIPYATQKKKKEMLRRKRPMMMESFSSFVKQLNETAMSSSFGEGRGLRHALHYVMPYLSKEGRAKTAKSFSEFHGNMLSKVDSSKHGELHNPKAGFTHTLEKSHKEHPAGTKINIEHVTHDGSGTIYAHTTHHGLIPLSKISKPAKLAKEQKTKTGFNVEKQLSSNLGTKSAGTSNKDYDFFYKGKGKPGSPTVRGKVKEVQDEGKGRKGGSDRIDVRGESKLEKGRFGVTKLKWDPKTKKWDFGGDPRMHEAFRKAKVTDENGKTHSVLDHLNKHHSDGRITRGFTVDAPKGTTRHYLKSGNVNTLHLHDKNKNKGTTFTVGNTSLKGRTNLGHLSDKDVDALDGKISIESNTNGKVGEARIAHSPKVTVMKNYAGLSATNPKNHADLTNDKHAKEFRQHVDRHIAEYEKMK